MNIKPMMVFIYKFILLANYSPPKSQILTLPLL
jgi:hypothetical protein